MPDQHLTEKLNIEIRYLKRARRATIRVKPGGVVKVSAPYGVNESELRKWISTKSDWIFKKHQILETYQNKDKIQFVSGQALPVYGRELRLKIVEGQESVSETEVELILSLPQKKMQQEASIKSAVVEWYKVKALEKIDERVAHYCSLVGVWPKSISIKNYKSRWGACSSKGDLIFNWQIVTFNQRLFDYVIAHEICHLKEMNHSPHFYGWLTKLGFTRSEIHPEIRNLRNLF